MRYSLLVFGMFLVSPVCFAGEVTVCEGTGGQVVVIRLNVRPGQPGETVEAVAARRLADTLDERPDLDVAKCFSAGEDTLPSEKRYAWRISDGGVIVDSTIPDPNAPVEVPVEPVTPLAPDEEPIEIPVKEFGAGIAGALTALGIRTITGRKKKETG